MPYIIKDKRKQVDEQLNSLINSVVEVSQNDIRALPGILNYCITVLIKNAYKMVTKKDVLSYADNNSAIGMLECAKQEFYRRQTAPYEDEKIIENGDV